MVVRAYKSSTQASEAGGSKKWSYPGLHKKVSSTEKKDLATILISSMYLPSKTTIFHSHSTLPTLLWWLNLLSTWLDRQMPKTNEYILLKPLKTSPETIRPWGLWCNKWVNHWMNSQYHGIMRRSMGCMLWLCLTLAPFCILSLLLEHNKGRPSFTTLSHCHNHMSSSQARSTKQP